MVAALVNELVAGVVGRPHGLDGSFHVLEGRPSLLTLGAHVSVSGADAEITRRAGTDEHPILRVDLATDRSAAEALRGVELRVRAEAAPELGDDEYWPEQLEGCAVRDGSVDVGLVKRMLPLPSCEALEVARSGGGPDLLVPMVRAAVRSIDVEARIVDIDLAFLGET